MRLRHIAALLSLLLCASCSEDELRADVEEEYVYTFVADLGGERQSRMNYEEDKASHNLKMVWEEGDVIRLYPDESMADPTECYEFVVDGKAGTSHTQFVYKGFIKEWTNWSGKAIYAFSGDENLGLDSDEKKEKFLAKIHTQIANNNTEHLKYAEHKLGDDGSKQYSEYWTADLDGVNLKRNPKITFNHLNTVVYKIMLRGFIYDVLNGSKLIMSGDAWPDEELVLTLGEPETPDNPGVFLKVGDYTKKYEKAGYTKDDYDDNAVLTAYMIRQVDSGTAHGAIKKGQKLYLKLLVYDPDDGKVTIKINDNDKQKHRKENGGADYFTNIPWAEEYLWKITATADRVYEAGDYVVADLTKRKLGGWYPDDNYYLAFGYDEANPRVAVDMGLPMKWATYNVRAEAVNDYGHHFVWGYVKPVAGNLGSQYLRRDEWTAGDPQYDAATNKWGSDWRMPEIYDLIDLYQYTDFKDADYTLKPADETGFWSAYWASGNSSPNRLVSEGGKLNPLQIGKILAIKSVSRLEPSKTVYFPLAGRGDRNTGIGNIGENGFYMTSPIPIDDVSSGIFQNQFLFLALAGTTGLMNINYADPTWRCYSIRPVKAASPATAPYSLSTAK